MTPDFFTDAASHFLRQMANARVSKRPFQHFFCDNLFPEDFYAELQNRMPALEDYQGIADSGRVAATSESAKAAQKARYMILLTQAKMAALGPEKQAF